jgi:WD40 repeat protein
LENPKDRKTFRVNVEYDHVYKIVWSPDSTALLGFKAMENAIEVYRIEKREGLLTTYSKSITFPRIQENEDEIINLDISSGGRFIMSANNKTEITIWDVRGNILDKIDTFLITNYSAKISPCGRFIAASGFTPDIKLWEVKFDKSTREYEKTVRAFELTGHKTGVWDFAFNVDASHLVSVCKDGTFKLFDIKSKSSK